MWGPAEKGLDILVHVRLFLFEFEMALPDQAYADSDRPISEDIPNQMQTSRANCKILKFMYSMRVRAIIL